MLCRLIMPKTRARVSQRARKVGREATDVLISAEPNTISEPTERNDSPVTSTGSGSSSPALSLVDEFRSLCNQEVSSNQAVYTKYAQEIKKYMRNQFDFFGIKAPQRRRIQKEVIGKNSEVLADRGVLFSFIEVLWEQKERDFQAFGVDFCQQFRKELLGSTDDHFREALAKMEVCVVTKSWWDTVDYMAYQVIGYFVKERPALGVPVMDQWINHDNMWLRRVAILHQLNWKVDTDEARLFSMCLSRAHEKEFFIRKAIGWALRQYSRTNGPAVRSFVEKNRDSLSGLSIREALKYC